MSETKSSKVLTTGFGIPVGDDQNSLKPGNGALFLHASCVTCSYMLRCTKTLSFKRYEDYKKYRRKKNLKKIL